MYTVENCQENSEKIGRDIQETQKDTTRRGTESNYHRCILPPPFLTSKCHPVSLGDCIMDESKKSIIRDFETKMEQISHKKCDVCKSVGLNLDTVKNRKDKITRCRHCRGSIKENGFVPDWLPVWYKPGSKEPQFHVPEELSCLREGEKLMIQMLSPLVPIEHMRFGASGCRGHVCSFPQDIRELCTVLPRKKVNGIRVVKNYTGKDGEIETTTFKIRRDKVLAALYWLKKHNHIYRNEVVIDTSNLDWMGDSNEMDLDIDIIEIEEEMQGEGDAKNTNRTENTERSFGTLQMDTVISPAESSVDNALRDSLEEAGEDSMQWPFVSDKPSNEMDKEELLYAKAFPWLFPGGLGDYNCHREDDIKFDEWLKKMIMYQDGRFATDKLWVFYSLNVLQRKLNAEQGAYFVNSFNDAGPKSLQELQKLIADGDMQWLDKIAYFGKSVRGSASYWRDKRAQVYSWINYHVHKGHGAPSLFLTLSCAEYHWPDIHRLLLERYSLSGLSIPEELEECADPRTVNEYTIVIQEYFQIRVEQWLKTVGKQVLGITHHWLRYEFAPGRGQIHAHMLAICDNKEIMSHVHSMKHSSMIHNPNMHVANTLRHWSEQQFGLTANLPGKNVLPNDIPKKHHPGKRRFRDVEDAQQDARDMMASFQRHNCTEYCMRKRFRW